MRRLYYAIRERLTARVNLGDNWDATRDVYDLLAKELRRSAQMSMCLDGIDTPNHVTVRLPNGRKAVLFARYGKEGE
jgi:hypothetical protein